MRGHSVLAIVGTSLVMSWITGCASTKPIPVDPNPGLRDALNMCKSDVERLLNERSALEERALAAQREADDLRNRLASMPPPSTPAQAAPGWTPIPGGAMTTLAEDLLFAPGKVALRAEARKTLDQIVQTIESQYSEKDILVFGHTDDQPIRKSGWEDNWELSSERALAVVRYLGDHGIPHGRLVAAGAGEHWPRIDNKSDQSRAKNRRVEIFAIDHAQLHPKR